MIQSCAISFNNNKLMQGRTINNQADSDYLALDKLIPDNHFLKRISKYIDFSFVNELTESCYCPNNGRPSLSPEVYFKIMLIGYLYGIKSTRRLVQDVRYNICYRWFCGLTMNDSIPDHASLSRIKKRYSVDIFEAFFNSILKQCRDAGLLKSNSVMVDSTLFQANASLNSMQPLTDDACEVTQNSGRGIGAPARKSLSNKTHRSTTDPDATLAFKAGTTGTLKYKAHVCCDSLSRIILAIKITTGAVHDSQPYLELLNHLKTKLFLTIDEAIADRAYGSGNIIATLQSEGIKHFIPLFSTRSGTSASTVTPGFQYDAEKNAYICPAKYELKSGTRDKDYVYFHSKTENCRHCPLKTTCEAL